MYRYMYRKHGPKMCAPSILDSVFRQKGLQSPLPQYLYTSEKSHCSQI